MSFRFVPAEQVETNPPLILCLSGMTGSGKTYSALFIAQAIARARGGPVRGACSEAGRMAKYKNPKLYPELTPFEIAILKKPYSSEQFLEVVLYADENDTGALIIDSMTDEWEGEGGVLNRQESALDQMAGDDYEKRKKMAPRSWAAAKAPHNRLHNALLTLKTPLILCYRARPKTGFQNGKFVDLGILPIFDSRMAYDFTFHLLMDEEKQDGTYTLMKAGYKHERGVFPKGGRVDAEAALRLLAISGFGGEPPLPESHTETAQRSDSSQEPSPEPTTSESGTVPATEPPHEWLLQDDGSYQLQEGDPDSIAAKRTFFTTLKRHLAPGNRSAGAASFDLSVYRANTKTIKTLPETGQEELRKLASLISQQSKKD